MKSSFFSDTFSLTLTSKKAYAQSSSLLGGKANNLAWLSLHYPDKIPDWFVITTEAFKKHIGQKSLTELIRSIATSEDDSKMQRTLADIRKQIIKLPLPEKLSDEIKNQWQVLHHTSPDDFFAVRSSMVGEDAASASFAGQMDSFLFQKGIDQVMDAVKRCFASAFSDRAIAYRKQKSLPLDAIEGAVIVQKMIEGEVSGVFFTANPENGSRSQGLISATYGTGEGVVSGACATDEFTVGLFEGAVIDKQVNPKEEKIIFNKEKGSGVVQVSVKKELQDKPCLNDTQLCDIAKGGFCIAQGLKAPQDIEWTFAQGKLYFLQTRPITSLPYPKERKGKRIVWDNSNIEESYCGATTPLTLSFARTAYETVYKETIRTIGLPEKIINKESDLLSHLIGFVHGRVYYNINHWYRAFLYLPSFKRNKEDMERMMGLQDPVDFIEDTKLTFFQKLKKMPFLFINLLRFLREFSRMTAEVEKFQHYFWGYYKTIKRPLLHTLQLSELYELTVQLKHNLLERWERPIYNDFYVMMMNGKVRRALEASKVEDPIALQNNLLAGEEGIESTEPTKALLSITDKIRGEDDTLQKAFLEKSEYELARLVETQYPEVHQDCLNFIERFGDRCIGEQKFETISMREDPSFMFTIIKNFLKQPELTMEGFIAREKETRRCAEAIAFKEINKVLGARKLRQFKKYLSNFRDSVRNRENMRLNRSRMFGLFRSVYLEMGQQFFLYGVLESPRDIFYLTTQELDDYFNGVSIQNDFKSLVKSRKAEYATYETKEIPHHFETRGIIYHHTEYIYSGAIKVDPNAETLTGIGCYPGKVTAQVRLILSPDEEKSLDGRILCTRRTDPGWAPLFPSAGGIIVERGSTLSHSAVVARELGIPAIVNVAGVTRILKEGDTITLDGTKGVIHIHR